MDKRKEKIDEQLSKKADTEIENLKSDFISHIEEDKTSLFYKLYKNKGFDYAVIQLERYKFLGDKVIPKSYHDLSKFKAQFFQAEQSAN